MTSKERAALKRQAMESFKVDKSKMYIIQGNGHLRIREIQSKKFITTNRAEDIILL